MNYSLIKYFKFIPPELAHFFLKLIGLEIIEKSIFNEKLKNIIVG